MFSLRMISELEITTMYIGEVEMRSYLESMEWRVSKVFSKPILLKGQRKEIQKHVHVHNKKKLHDKIT